MSGAHAFLADEESEEFTSLEPAYWSTVQSKKDKPHKEKNVESKTINVPCKFYRLGKCAAGKSCKFVHEDASSTNLNPTTSSEKLKASSSSDKTVACKFHTGGYCRNGTKCGFSHVSAKKAVPTTILTNPNNHVGGTQGNGTHAYAGVGAGTSVNGNYQPVANGFSNGHQFTATAVNTPNHFSNPTITTTSSVSNGSAGANSQVSKGINITSLLTAAFQQNNVLSPPSVNGFRLLNPPAPKSLSSSYDKDSTMMSLWPSSLPNGSASTLNATFSPPPPRNVSSSLPGVSFINIPSVSSLGSSPSFSILSTSPYNMFPIDVPEEQDDEDDDNCQHPAGLTIIDDTPDDFVFNPFDDQSFEDPFQGAFPKQKTAQQQSNNKTAATDPINHPHQSPQKKNGPSAKAEKQSSDPEKVLKSYADIAKTGITTQMISDDAFLSRMDEDPDEAAKLCQFFMQGICRYGTACRYIHGNICDTCEKPCLVPDDPQQNENHRLSCSFRITTQKEREQSKDLECGICYEKTVEKGRRFGLLSHCDHPFCLDCIREWRGGGGGAGGSTTSTSTPPTATLRSCPICRITSYFIIPSDGLVTSYERKAEIIESYKEKLSTITCKYFKQGKGTCKFGSSCMYAHANPDGTPFVFSNRKMQDADGEVTFYNGIKLFDFI